MEIKVQLKHIVIPIIVFSITIISLFYQYNNYDVNSGVNIMYLFSENSISDESIEQTVWNDIKLFQDEYLLNNDPETSPALSVDYMKSTSSGDAKAKLDSALMFNNLILVQGDGYNNYLQEVIDQNSSTNFILISNSLDIEKSNVVNVDIDLEEITSVVSKELQNKSTTNKYIYISSLLEVDNKPYEKFKVNLPKNSEVMYQYVEDNSKYLNVKEGLLLNLKEGYDSIFVEDMTLNEIVVSTAVEYQTEISEYYLEKSRPVDIEKEEVITEEKPLEEVEEKELVEVDQYPNITINVATVGNSHVELGTYLDTVIVDELDVQTTKSISTYNVKINFLNTFSDVINSVIKGEFKNYDIILNKKNKGIEYQEQEVINEDI